ncbi:MAG TPA: transporter [Terriglobia bacterium]|nr:transporter [Terriglobia bacterium]
MTRYTPKVCMMGLLLSASVCHAQTLTPRAYIITPVHSNAITMTYSYSTGSTLFDPNLPITDAKSTFSTPVISFYHSLDFFGRSANIAAIVPYVVGDFSGNVLGNFASTHRSGLGDLAFRFSVNLLGGPAMSLKEMSSWRQKTLVGVSLVMTAPTGQYDPTRLLNLGTNRWEFKPELGVSRRRGKFILDAYGGVWFYTTNPEFFSHNQYFPGTSTLSQQPIGATEMHFSYDVKPRYWVSFDANYWYGGRSSLNGVEHPTSLLSSSRLGVTGSIPVTKHSSVKLSYSDGLYIRLGGNYQTISIAYQYSWFGKPN